MSLNQRQLAFADEYIIAKEVYFRYGRSIQIRSKKVKFGGVLDNG